MDDETGTFSSDPELTFAHPYPPTKLMFIPDKEGSRPDLLATTGDYLRIWLLTENDGTVQQKLLNNVGGLVWPTACCAIQIEQNECGSGHPVTP